MSFEKLRLESKRAEFDSNKHSEWLLLRSNDDDENVMIDDGDGDGDADGDGGSDGKMLAVML